MVFERFPEGQRATSGNEVSPERPGWRLQDLTS